MRKLKERRRNDASFDIENHREKEKRRFENRNKKLREARITS